ncbi:MAG: hypothetical protein U0903_18185 [Planctomycetales bacterium]
MSEQGEGNPDGEKTIPADDPDVRLTDEQQAEFLDLIGRGLSPSVACQKLEVSLKTLRRTYDDEKQFRHECDAVGTALNENVEMALYIAAMKGNVSAQTLWLRKRPPPGWMPDEERRTVSDCWDDLSDEELIKLARSAGFAVPAEIVARTANAGDAEKPARVSEPGADSGERGAVPE